MKEYLKKNGIRLGVILLAVILVVTVSSQVLGGSAGFLTNIIVAVREPINKAATSAGSLLDGLYGYIFEYEQLQAELEATRNELAAAQEEVRAGQEAVEENRRYEELLGFAEDNPDYVMEQARITSWSASNWASSFMISKGSDDGIEVGDAVITESGALVGQVSEVAATSATVNTIIDVDTRVGVLVGTNGSAAMLVGDYTLMTQGQAQVTWLTEGAQLFLDDTILTSGSGDQIPSGLVVGTVTSIQSEAAGQTEYGIITPAADLGSLVQVFIITDFGNSASQNSGDTGNTGSTGEQTSPTPEPTASATPAAEG
ncbi:MAG TPA: rod shape-determining protein MreC [Candidatus Scatomorpha merdigallinarum]|nr:rod shape-determining protein MreC [Candidatus Scatomorpha merdigallinarum]